MRMLNWLNHNNKSNRNAKQAIQSMPLAHIPSEFDKAAKDIVKLVKWRASMQSNAGEKGLIEAIYHIHEQIGNSEKLDAKVLSMLTGEYEVSFYMKAVQPRRKPSGFFIG